MCVGIAAQYWGRLFASPRQNVNFWMVLSSTSDLTDNDGEAILGEAASGLSKWSFVTPFDFILPAVILLGASLYIAFRRPRRGTSVAVALMAVALAILSSSFLRAFALAGIMYLIVTVSTGNLDLLLPGSEETRRAEIHYRLDMDFVVDGQPMTGSVVQSVVVKRTSGDGVVFARAQTGLTGEALVVDLPGTTVTLVVVMYIPGKESTNVPGDGESRFTRLFFLSCDLRPGSGEDIRQYIRRLNDFTGSCGVPPDFVPLWLAVTDKGDASSIVAVDPQDTRGYLGADVRLVGAAVSVTDEPLTTGILTRLPWLSDTKRIPVTSASPAVLAPPYLDRWAFIQEALR